jgi:hypothetical protein
MAKPKKQKPSQTQIPEWVKQQQEMVHRSIQHATKNYAIEQTNYHSTPDIQCLEQYSVLLNNNIESRVYVAYLKGQEPIITLQLPLLKLKTQ